MSDTPVPAKTVNEILAFFDRTADQFLSRAELRAKLKSGQKLRIKYGVDVTTPTLHIGHAVNLWLMRYMQDRGHKIVFVIGDFTTRIGDPDGRLETRPMIPQEDIEHNASLFIEQARMVLRFDDPSLIEVRRNSEWYGKMPLNQFMDLLSLVTHARLIARDMFQMRIAQGKEIYAHELVYPILQGFDSMTVKSDLAIIGSDQMFNETLGRLLQEKFGGKPQTLVTTKITPGIDGKGKQSKSAGNYIGLTHSPRDKFGRIMSIPDGLIEEYFRIYTDVPIKDIEDMRPLIEAKPRDAKILLAHALVSRYHGEKAAEHEQEWFVNAVSRGGVPEDIPALPVMDERLVCLELIKMARPEKSNSDNRRLIKQGGVELNGKKITEPDAVLGLATNDILKVGKRSWFRIVVVRMTDLVTDRLLLREMKLENIDLAVKYVPEWEVSKYISQLPQSRIMQNTLAADAFRRVINQPPPRTEWLWTIASRENPNEVIGVAHLRREAESGSQNVWLGPQFQNDDIVREAMVALNEHAFNELGFNTMLYRNAFRHASRDAEALRTQFMKLEPGLRKHDDAATLSVSREAWRQSHPKGAQQLAMDKLSPSLVLEKTARGLSLPKWVLPGEDVPPGFERLNLPPLDISRAIGLPIWSLPGQALPPGFTLSQMLSLDIAPGEILPLGFVPGRILPPHASISSLMELKLMPGQMLPPGYVMGAGMELGDTWLPGLMPGQVLQPTAGQPKQRGTMPAFEAPAWLLKNQPAPGLDANLKVQIAPGTQPPLRVKPKPEPKKKPLPNPFAPPAPKPPGEED
ncbi:MAG: tyrosine--tRNA ligase [Alphaproteobacteria bacterium]